eukprot:TRINITY_DN3066_c1_g1_i1.p1 TRINITY_DN3066_c1_g1~~TRINITY_DN3066_c1_g1_i1.p1  ORF type:complete len:698 (-),score=179.49 TRINITY_DN3066_c1_g1_i1:730-2823(-)
MRPTRLAASALLRQTARLEAPACLIRRTGRVSAVRRVLPGHVERAACSPLALALPHVQVPHRRGSGGAAPDAAVSASSVANSEMSRLRNFGISAHIDSGKTTLTERILFYTGKIAHMHEVKGADGKGATMDSMELERERGITIKSAATYVDWEGPHAHTGERVKHHFNIIDTPGHVDFTIEVERSLKVLDGAVLVLCGVGSVQSQTLTVHRQMERYSVPRLVFINKLDRTGALVQGCVQGLRQRLQLNTAMVTSPVGIEGSLCAVYDLVNEQLITFSGYCGVNVQRRTIDEAAADGFFKTNIAAFFGKADNRNLYATEGLSPVGDGEEVTDAVVAKVVEEYKQLVDKQRRELLETVGNADEEVMELFLMEEPVPADVLARAIRRTVASREFAPIFCGSAIRNVGVQPMLDGVISYLPTPLEKPHKIIRVQPQAKDAVTEDTDGQQGTGPREVEVTETVYSDASKPLLAMTFKMEESKMGTITYLKVFHGMLTRANGTLLTGDGQTVKCSGLVRMHADKIEPVTRLGSGDVGGALLSPELPTGTSLVDPSTKGSVKYRVSSIFIPPAVVSVTFAPEDPMKTSKMNSVIQRFLREDPSLRKVENQASKEIVLAGMGELHLEIYAQRLEREAGIKVRVGDPFVTFRESISGRVDFSHRFKRQSGGRGMFAELRGYIEPIEVDVKDDDDGGIVACEFVDGP